MPDPNDYIVGWICAIATEYIAAQAFLDERHEEPEFVAPNDNNDYTLGKIGKHNVVIAVLPDGEYGTSAATAVAKDMLHSFPNVRIGLLVGIGGGAPGAHDIRLGDIVVSAPRAGQGGVLQYDFGKTVHNRNFQATGFLNKPPMVLRTAVSGLQSRYALDGHQIDEEIRKILKKRPRIRKKYQRPDSSRDRLYKSDIIFLDDIDTSDDPSALVLRPERDEEEDDPVIHYGLIASGNHLMENALLRDRLAKEKDILCFETEAAGLMNHFPCIIVRGICDYSDTHKNDEWQGYAAMAAAAYAKDLLKRIPPNKVEAERKITEVLSSVEQKINETSHDVKQIASDQRESHIRAWLSPSDPSTNFNEALKQRQKGTGHWFLSSSQFEAWVVQPKSFLWLNGIPGCGKTILSTSIIEHLKYHLAKPVIYFYFTFSNTDKQTLENLLRSLIHQIYHSKEAAHGPLEKLYSNCDSHNQPGYESLSSVLVEMMRAIGKVWIVLDALDECTTRKGPHGLLSWIENLLTLEQSGIHLLVTSRPEHDIQSRLDDLGYERYSISLQSKSVRDDIRAYIQSRIKERDGLRRWRSRPDVQLEIEEMLMEKANGMFRWVTCQLDIVEDCLDYATLKEALVSLPTTLDETYDRIIQAIPAQYQQAAIRILQLLTFSENPPLVREVIDAIAVRVEKEPHFDPKNRIPEPQEIMRYCSSLVVTDSWSLFRSLGYGFRPMHPSETLLRLAHFSVKEYLTSERLNGKMIQYFQAINAHTNLASVSVAYLLGLDNKLGLQDVERRYPFVHYAAQFWMDHARVREEGRGSEEDQLDMLIKRLLCDPKSSTVWYSAEESREDGVRTPALYFAVFGGLRGLAKALLEEGADVNAQGGLYGNALQAAAYRNDEYIVRLLLDNGAKINAEGGKYGTALQVAASKGHEKLVHILLEKGANVNSGHGKNRNALQAASKKGHEQLVRLFLSKGATVNVHLKDLGERELSDSRSLEYGPREYFSALQAASAKGHLAIVQLLLAAGADVNAGGRYYGSALEDAVVRGHEDVVRILLYYGASVETLSRAGNSILCEASYFGLEEIIELLIDNGAKVDAQVEGQANPLCAASSNGHKRVVELLLDNGAETNGPRDLGEQALRGAIEEGCEEIARLLVARGCSANPNKEQAESVLMIVARQNNYSLVKLLLDGGANVNFNGSIGNALMEAGEAGHEHIVKLLLENGAHTGSHYRKRGDTLNLASRRGYYQIVELLLDYGADIDAESGPYGNALHAAAGNGHEQIVKLLVERGANVNAPGEQYKSALEAASKEGYVRIVQLLIDQGIDVEMNHESALKLAHSQFIGRIVEFQKEVKNAYRPLRLSDGDMLYYASSKGLEHIVWYLLGRGYDVNAPGRELGTALQVASYHGLGGVVKVLISNGADINTSYGRHGSALQTAAHKGRELLMKLLIDHGADVNTRGGKYGSAIQAAAYQGFERIVKLLIDHGADVNIAGGRYGSPLRAASDQKHDEVVRLLIANGAEYLSTPESSDYLDFSEWSDYPSDFTRTTVSSEISSSTVSDSSDGEI